jgi:muramoyltetrapeptide carboxypeptidase
MQGSSSAPPPLREGSLVRIVAASSPFDRARFDAGLALIETRYRTRLAPALFAREGFLAGNDEARLAALRDALADHEAGAIVPARGGYGATRLLPSLAVEEIRRANKWLVGFSDVTALHARWARAGLCSIHGPMVASLSDAPEAVRDAWFALLEGAPTPTLRGLERVRAGRARGRLLGGNLTVLAALVGTPYMPDLRGAVLMLEDISERPYRLDRTLTTLLQAGALNGAAGALLGQFAQCEPGPDGVTALAVLSERLGTLGIPILANAPFGHVPGNVPMLLGAEVELDAIAGTVHFLGATP